RGRRVDGGTRGSNAGHRDVEGCSVNDDYETDEASGKGWELWMGDSCERLTEIPDNSVSLSVYSPPFASLFTYSPSIRDLGNCDTREEFLQHYAFIIRENLRVTAP